MLIRISLIIAIVAGIAVGALNFVMVKEKITTLVTQRDSEKSQKETAQKELATTKQTLNKTTADLKTTKEVLAQTTKERDTAVAEATAEKKRADGLTADLAKTRSERDTAQQELAAYRATDLKPDQIIAMGKQFKGLQSTIAGLKDENKLLGQRIKRLSTELALYQNPDYVVPLPPQLQGKVLVTDPKWNFVVLNVGEDQGVQKDGELLINRNGKLVAKVRVRSVQKDRCVANIVPGWQLGDVLEGDQAIPAHRPS
jgi:myosin heavy subunit